MAQAIVREFNMEDLLMLERAQIFHNAFIVDDADFIAAFPHLALPFATDFQTAIDEADAIPSGSEVDAEIAVVTEELNNLLPLGQKALQKLFTYANVAFNSKAKVNLFGKNKYEKARTSDLRMKELLEQANRQAEVAVYKTALLAAGYTQADIDELKTISDDIDAKNALQEDMLSSRGDKSEARIIAYNKVWGFMKQINIASKVVFVDNPAKIELYLLYPTHHTSLGKVQNLTAVFEGAPVPNGVLNWDFVFGGIDYEIQRSDVPVGQPPGTFVDLITVQNNTYTDFVGGGQTFYYRVRAKNASLTGAWSDIAQMDT